MFKDYNKVKGLYIHIPFCDHICAYCDFKKMIAKDELKDAYIDALLLELEYRYNNNLLGDIQTIYIGGGTPSSLSFDLLEKLLNKLKELINLDKIVEFTIEANPKDINSENIGSWISLFTTYHINRLSLGIQSFNNNKLNALGRNHTKKDAIEALKLLKENNFNNVNCDLIFGLKNDTFNLIKKDIKYAYIYGCSHISTYSLILEEHTLLYNMVRLGKTVDLDSDKEADIYYKICKYLKKLSYKQYEISKFSINCFESKHNLLTWDNLHYIGVGVSASSYVDKIRFTNIKSVKDYIRLINESKFTELSQDIINLDQDDIIYEHLILGLRKTSGICLCDFENRYNCKLTEHYPNIKKLIKDNILEIKDGNLRIVCDKIYLENAIINEIIG